MTLNVTGVSPGPVTVTWFAPACVPTVSTARRPSLCIRQHRLRCRQAAVARRDHKRDLQVRHGMPVLVQRGHHQGERQRPPNDTGLAVSRRQHQLETCRWRQDDRLQGALANSHLYVGQCGRKHVRGR